MDPHAPPGAPDRRAELPYDYLIVATGATHSYFGHDEWAAVAPGLKSIEDALEIRRRVFLAFEAAERERRSRAAGGVADLRHHRRRPHRGGAGRRAGGDRPPQPAAATSAASIPTQARVCWSRACRGCCPPTPRSSRAKAAAAAGDGWGWRCGPDHGSPASTARACTIGGERLAARTVHLGGRAWRRRRWPDRWACRWIAPGRVLVEPDLTIPGHARCSSSATWPTWSRTASRSPACRPRPCRRAGTPPPTSAARLQGQPPALPLLGQGQLRRHRPRGGGGRLLGRLKMTRLSGLAGLAVHPHLLPDRLPQPPAGAVRLGLLLPHLPPRGPPHHRRGAASRSCWGAAPADRSDFPEEMCVEVRHATRTFAMPDTRRPHHHLETRLAARCAACPPPGADLRPHRRRGDHRRGGAVGGPRPAGRHAAAADRADRRAGPRRPSRSAPRRPAALRPRVELVFALDTTSSMSGLIEGAKQKIWSIASFVAQGQPTPDLRVG